MSVEAFTQASHMLRALQTDEQFEHFGDNSRGIRVQTDSLISGFGTLIAREPDLSKPLTYIGALIHKASVDYGTYVRIAGSPIRISIDVRGETGPLNEYMTMEELEMVALRRSGIDIMLDPNGTNVISAHGYYLETANGQRIKDVINGEVDKLTDEQRERLVLGLITLVTQEVAQSGEFVNLG